ncbi:MAG: SpoIIIAH-like family protein [Clostridia bacterium]|nr:SpoIIIAH-like family protein [Clostridia bacterium]
MVMTNKKKIIIMSGLVLLLAVTAVFNFVLAGATDSSVSAGGSVTTNYFTTYRNERTTTRNEELVQLDSVIALYEEGSEEYQEAAGMKLEIVTAMEQELILETMIKSLGFSDCVVSLSTESDNVNVFINSAELNYDTALQIYNMLKNETGIVAGNIIIMPVYSES